MGSTLDERLVRAAVDGQVPALDGVSEAELGLASWRSLVLLEAHLPAGSALQKRVQGLRRSNFYATSMASGLAVTLCERLAGCSPMVFGDLALASVHYRRPGDRPVGYLAIYADCDRDHLAAVLSSLPDVGQVDAGRYLVRTQINGMAVGLHRAWPPLMAGPGVRLDANPALTETPAGSFPAVSERIEALRTLSAGQQNPDDPSWLLDLAAISPGEQVFAEVAALANRLQRQTAVHASWSQAHRFGIAPEPPAMSDPFAAGLTQRLALSSHRVPRAFGYRLLRHGARA